MSFGFFEVVAFAHDDPEFAEINGLEGYVAGKAGADDPEIGVFFYDIERVWQVPAAHCRSLGRFDEAQRAHSQWAARRIAEENGAALRPPPTWHLADGPILAETIGRSRAWVYRVGEHRFIKTEPIAALAELRGEVERLRWLGATGMACPIVLDATEYDGQHWLLMSAVPGHNLAFSPDLPHETAISILAGALRSLHALEPAGCPFDHRAERRLAAAEARLDAGLVEMEDGAAELARLTATRPQHEDFVVTHGDPCLPNLLARDGVFTGFIDCGRLGVADRYQDLALACWSLTHNFGAGHAEAFLVAYGIAEPDRAKLDWYKALDEFF